MSSTTSTLPCLFLSAATSGSKYRLVMTMLRESGFPLITNAPDPMPRAWLEAIHDPTYVSEVLEACLPSAKERRIGFPVTPRVAARVAHTNGGTWLATLLAARHGYVANGGRAVITRFTTRARAIACSTTWP